MQREDDARTKWCPFVRVRIASSMDTIIAGNRARTTASPTERDAVDAATRCLGSGCAAWEVMAEYLDNTHTYGRCGLTQPSS